MRSPSLLLVISVVLLLGTVLVSATSLESDPRVDIEEHETAPNINVDDSESGWEISRDTGALDGLGCSCKDKTAPVGPCNVKVSVCGCIHSWKWKYKCTATSTKTGRSASYSYTDSAKGCADHVIINLFNVLSEPGECNCVTGETPIGKCPLNWRACFYFTSESQLNNKQSSWKAFVDGAPKEGTSTNQPTPQDAVSAGMVSVMSLNPAFVESCKAPMDDNLIDLSDRDLNITAEINAEEFGKKVNGMLHTQSHN